jgi:hypothetical protein
VSSYVSTQKKGLEMGKIVLEEHERKRLYKVADDIAAFLNKNEAYFKPRQLIQSHSLMCLLVEFIELVDKRKVKKAARLQYQIETKLVSLFQQNIRK